MTIESSRRKRNVVGVVAIILLVIFFLLEFARIIDFIGWLILVLVVFVVANIVLRMLKKRETAVNH